MSIETVLQKQALQRIEYAKVNKTSTLFLSSSFLDKFPCEVLKLENIEYLYLDDNSFILPDAILDLPKLKCVYLDNRGLDILHVNIFIGLLGKLCIQYRVDIRPYSIQKIVINGIHNSLEYWLKNGFTQIAKTHDYCDTEIETTKLILIKFKEFFNQLNAAKMELLKAEESWDMAYSKCCKLQDGFNTERNDNVIAMVYKEIEIMDNALKIIDELQWAKDAYNPFSPLFY